MSMHYQPGNYWVKVVDQGLSETSNGNTQFVLTFEIQGMIDRAVPSGDLIACDNYTRSIYRVITEKTVDYVLEDIKHLCGIANMNPTLPGFEFLDPATDHFLDFRGIELEVYCQKDTYNGEEKERWGISRQVNKEKKEASKESVRKLNALFGKQLKSLANGSENGTTQTKTRQKPEPQPATINGYPADEVEGDDVPF